MSFRDYSTRAVFVLFLLAGPVGWLNATEPFDQVASILGRHCLRCHNDLDQQGDFSLQTAKSMEESGHLEPRDINSRLLAVIEASDDDPPEMPKDAEPLKEQEVDAIRRWIASGAAWPTGATIDDAVSDFSWWSLRPITRPDIPQHDSDWDENPIDAFILAKHREFGLTHSVEADRKTLIRRLTYDLTGLPPTPEQVSTFVNDSDSEAYEKMVDRLLDSKAYGERWARHWLDVVKYADTCGYDKDKLRPNAWPYRDYVIRSFNQDKPYSRFVREQIAGDVLYPNDPDGILALGFIAAGPWDFIGHVEVPESKIDGKVARNLDRDEMVTNTLNTFCSVTIQCARCHNHKFDPFTQEHYYSLQAIFAAVDRAERVYDLDPGVEDQRFDLQTRLKKVDAETRELEKQIADDGGPQLAKLREQASELEKQVGVVKDPEFGYHSQIVDDPATEKWVEVQLADEVDIAKIVLRPCHDDYKGIGEGFGFPVRYRVTVRRETEGEHRDQEVVVWDTELDLPNPGLSPVEIAVEGEPASVVRVTATRLAERDSDYIFAIAELQVFDSDGNNVALDAKVSSLDSIEAPARWQRKNLVDGRWAQPKDRAASQRLIKVKQELAGILARVESPERIERKEELASARKEIKSQLDALPAGKVVYAAATRFKEQGNFKPTGGTPRSVHLLHRGNIEQPLALMQPGLLPLEPGSNWKLADDATEADRRASLARWLTDTDNPLPWRSIVNRVWQYHFGRGLVATPNDFGRMGARPTHPALLDWLAVEFRDGGQSFKKLHRLIVTSRAYRQTSDVTPSNAAIDGSNQYLWRMMRRRLSAEEIRDSILAVSGSLDPKMGGPGFYLFELEKTTHSPHYEYHKFDPADPRSHRRSVYRFIVRSQPDPYMTTLDCADSSQSTPTRTETLTSLQALSLLNNKFNLEMSKRFANRLRKESGDESKQVERGFWLVTGRSPTDQEHANLLSYSEDHGLENVCRVLLNLSEFVFLD